MFDLAHNPLPTVLIQYGKNSRLFPYKQSRRIIFATYFVKYSMYRNTYFFE